LDDVIKQGLCTRISQERFEVLNFNKLNTDNKVALTLIDNGNFTALCVVYCENELKYIQNETLKGEDKRPMKFYICNKETAEKEIRGI
jgi:hypothetical protein